MMRQFALLVCLLVAGALHAASGPAYPMAPDGLLDDCAHPKPHDHGHQNGACASCARAPDCALPRLVRLPGDPTLARTMLFDWNRQQIAANGGEVVPQLGQIYGETATDAGRLWALDADGWEDMAPAVRSRMVFDLRRSAVESYLLLVVPEGHADLARRLQGYVNQSWRALGHAQPLYSGPKAESQTLDLGEALGRLVGSSGIYQLLFSPANIIMILVGLLLYYLAIVKGFEPLLLIPIATGCIFVNAAGAGMGDPATVDGGGGILWYFFEYGIATGIFPLLIFLGVGALTDFGPLLANPWSALLGAAAQFGIFASFLLAAIGWMIFYGDTMPIADILKEAGAIAIIGGADGPTSIYTASVLAPHLLGAIAVAAYSYMALVPIIQPPVMRAFTTEDERKIMMQQAKPVSKRARIVFPIATTLLCVLLIPDAVPLIGMLMFGNLLRESGVADRLAKAAQNELINLTTIGLGLSVGMKMSADKFLDAKTLGILILGCLAFVVGTAAGVLFGKLMCRMSGGKVNPLIGSAGVSAVPMAARVSQTEGARWNRRNFLLMHAMGPNVAGVIGSAVAAGILINLLG